MFMLEGNLMFSTHSSCVPELIMSIQLKRHDSSALCTRVGKAQNKHNHRHRIISVCACSVWAILKIQKCCTIKTKFLKNSLCLDIKLTLNLSLDEGFWILLETENSSLIRKNENLTKPFR